MGTDDTPAEPDYISLDFPFPDSLNIRGRLQPEGLKARPGKGDRYMLEILRDGVGTVLTTHTVYDVARADDRPPAEVRADARGIRWLSTDAERTYEVRVSGKTICEISWDWMDGRVHPTITMEQERG